MRRPKIKWTFLYFDKISGRNGIPVHLYNFRGIDLEVMAKDILTPIERIQIPILLPLLDDRSDMMIGAKFSQTSTCAALA